MAYAGSLLTTSFVFFVLATIVFRAKSERSYVQFWGWFCAAFGLDWLAIAVSSLGFQDDFWVLLLARTGLALGIVASIFHLGFTFAYFGFRKVQRSVFIAACGYAGILIVLLFFSNWIITSVSAYGYGIIQPKAGILMPLMTIVPIFSNTVAIVLFGRALHASSGQTRQQLIYLLLAMIILLVGGCGSFLPIFGIHPLLALIPFILIIAAPVLVTYAIIRHRLWGIRTIIHRTLAWLTLLVALTVPLYGLILLGLPLFKNLSRIQLAFVATICFLVAYAYIRALKPYVDAKFHRRTYDRRRLLDDIALDLHEIHDSKAAISLILSTIEKVLYSTDVRLLLSARNGTLSSTSMMWHQHHIQSGKLVSQPRKKAPSTKLIEYMARPPYVFDAGFTTVPSFTSEHQLASNFLRNEGATIGIPLSHRTSLLGMILLGEKKTLKPYTSEDFAFLEHLRIAISGGLANSLLFAKVKNLAEGMARGKDEEAARIARELHDELGQILTGLKIDLAMAARKAKKQPDDAQMDALHEQLNQSINITTHAIKTVQRISTELRPPMLDKFGLNAAIEWLIEETKRRTQISFQTKISTDDSKYDRTFSTTIFRIVQESLTNVARHAHAENVVIEISDDNNLVHVIIIDDGIGIPDSEFRRENSIGLTGMAERAQLFDGDLNISRGREKGTKVELHLPIKTK